MRQARDAKGGEASVPRPAAREAKGEFAEEEVATLPRMRAPSRGRISIWEEVDMDEIVVVHDGRSSLGRVSVVPTARVVSTPLAFDAPVRSPSEAPTTASIPAIAPKRSRVALVGASLLVAAVAIGAFSASGVRYGASRPIAAAAPKASPMANTPPPAVTVAVAAPPEPIAAPAPTAGTIAGSPLHRLYVDGRLVPGWKAEVKCGPHTAKVGSQGVTRTIDVPCGGEATLGP